MKSRTEIGCGEVLEHNWLEKVNIYVKKVISITQEKWVMIRFWREGSEEWSEFKEFRLHPDSRNSAIIFKYNSENNTFSIHYFLMEWRFDWREIRERGIIWEATAKKCKFVIFNIWQLNWKYILQDRACSGTRLEMATE